MSTTWDSMLDSDDFPCMEDAESTFGEEDYVEQLADGDRDTEYFEFLSSTRKLPSAQWGLDSSRDPAQKPEWF